ncbi:hypothetical protein GCM10023198_12810 [Promicromonospora umidemergens]|uniref:Uncharacterized protein n=1 Tax=Promicromonospora umidemergens TaxID=629679 RepID=A0ABP8WUZ5_9MICO
MAETAARAMVRAPRAAVARRDTVNSLVFEWFGRGSDPRHILMLPGAYPRIAVKGEMPGQGVATVTAPERSDRGSWGDEHQIFPPGQRSDLRKRILEPYPDNAKGATS